MEQGRLEAPDQGCGQSSWLARCCGSLHLRDSVITNLIRARLPTLTVGQLSGMSVKHYGHPVRDDAEEALASIAV